MSESHADSRVELLCESARAAVEAVAPGALDKGGEEARRALDLLGANVLRALAMDMVQKANSGHPGGPCSSMDFAWVLHQRYLRASSNPDWRDRDRFILSGGHMSTLLYGLLFLQGRISMEDLQDFRQLGSKTQGHPVAGFAPGIETTTGPLGQGFANGVGMALGEALARRRFGSDLVDHRTWVLATDGDLQEGVCREAMQLAGHWKLGKLNVFFDSNDVQLASKTDACWSEDIAQSFEASGWHVQTIDGHDHAALDTSILAALSETDRPSVIIGRTQIAKGTNLEGEVKTHGSPLGAEVIADYKARHGHPARDFWMPEAVAQAFRPQLDQGDQEEASWQERVENILSDSEEASQAWGEFYGPERGKPLMAKIEEAIRSMSFEGSIATRASAGKALAAIAKAVPSLVGGSADLAGSTKTSDFEKVVGHLGESEGEGPETPRGLHFGVREHAMASIANGLSLHGGWLPLVGTFLVFSDYLRGAIRLGSISKLPVSYVLTHDSIFLGEDGETHQPVEHVESLRLIPGVEVLRPADAYEAAEAWIYTLKKHLSGDASPICLVLSRQGVPTLEGGFERAQGLHQGAYVVRGEEGSTPDLEILASGSEVSLALDAAALLESDGIETRVVSVPNRERFEKLTEEERAEILGPECRFRMVLEAGRVKGWDGLGKSFLKPVGIDRYGQSAPAEELAEEYGFTAEAVAETARGFLDSRRQLLEERIRNDLAYLESRFPEEAKRVRIALGA